jgi:hypothetical protein
MKKNGKNVLSFGLIILLTIFSSFNPKKYSEYDIAAIYQGKDVSNAKIITDDGVKDAETILFPLKLETGKYVVNITRKGKDVYKVDGKNIYIETRYCYEYSSGQEVILSIESSYGYTVGKIKF